MGVKINLSGSNISGNARVLNGLKVTGKNDAEINVTQSSMSGKSQILNNMNMSENSSVNIGIKNSEMKDQARVLNDMEVKNGKVDVNIENLSLGQDVEFMNSRKANENSSINYNQSQTSERTTARQDNVASERTTANQYNEASEQTTARQDNEVSEQATVRQHTTQTVTSTRNKRKGLLKRIMSILKGNDVNAEIEIIEEDVSLSSILNPHKAFENEISNGGSLKNIDTTEAIRNAENSTTKERNSDLEK